MDGMNELVEKTKTLTIAETYFYGLQGLDTTKPLYRVCRYDEDTDRDIVCKAKTKEDMERTVNQHVTSGSKKPSRFISTTASLDVALEWAFYAKDEPCNSKKEKREKACQPIIKIDLTKIETQDEESLINLTNETVMRKFVEGPIQPARVKSSKEVLFQWRIPKRNVKREIVFELLESQEYVKPLPPKCKNCKCKK